MGLILADLSCAMAPDATVNLGGCNVGLGCRGEDFLVAFARNLLPGGGRVRAAQQYVVGIRGGLIAPRSADGHYQELRVAPGPSNATFSVAPQTQRACIDRSEERLGQLRQVAERVRHCPICAEGQTAWCVSSRDRTLLDERETAGEYRAAHVGFQNLERRPIWNQQACPVGSAPPATDLRGIREERMRRALEAD